MRYYFHQPFIDKIKSLLRKKSYNDCEKAIIKDIFLLSIQQIMTTCAGKRLNASSTNPIAKLRVGFNSGKSSSYRIYVYAIINDGKIYFAYGYPKTGSKGQSALSAKEETSIIKELLLNIKANKTFEVILNIKKDKIIFKTDKTDVF